MYEHVREGARGGGIASALSATKVAITPSGGNLKRGSGVIISALIPHQLLWLVFSCIILYLYKPRESIRRAAGPLACRHSLGGQPLPCAKPVTILAVLFAVPRL